MAGNGGGDIINLASMAAIVGLPGGAAYSGSKAALVAMTRSWAAEYGAGGVRVNAVAPGPVFTEGAKNTEALARTTLLNRAAQPEEVAETIAFLASRPAPATSPAPPSPSTAVEPPSDPTLQPTGTEGTITTETTVLGLSFE